MNDLTVLSDAELSAEVREMDRRREYIGTPKGRIRAEKRIMEILAYLTASGYRPPKMDRDAIAAAWADQLEDAIVIYGFDALMAAAKEFVKTDMRDYHQWPTTGNIIAALRAVGHNPKAEVARREKNAREAKLEAQWAAEKAEHRKNRDPDEVNAFRERYLRHLGEA